MAVIATNVVEVTPVPLKTQGGDPYNTQRKVNAELGLLELLFDIIETGRYKGTVLTAVGEEVTIPAGTVLWMDVPGGTVAKVETKAAIVESTNEAGGDDTLIARLVADVDVVEGSANLRLVVEAVATPPAEAIVLGVTTTGTFAEDAGLDSTIRFRA